MPFKKDSKKVKKCAKKVLTGAGDLRYNNRAVSDTASAAKRQLILENDTESRRTRNRDFHESRFTKTVNSKMSFNFESDAFRI